jgi:hypothetical protein
MKTKITLNTMKLNNKTHLFEQVATTSIEQPTIKQAERFLKSYLYKFDAMLSSGPIDIWSKRTVTKQGEYLLHAELKRGA